MIRWCCDCDGVINIVVVGESSVRLYLYVGGECR